MMNTYYRAILAAVSFLVLLVSCSNEKHKTNVEISGTIRGSKAKMLYLDEVAVETMYPVVVDSVKPGSDGSFKLKAYAAESKVFNIRMDGQEMPVASVINDTAKITLDISPAADGNPYAGTYEVKGSPASQQIRDFIYRFNKDMQQLFVLGRRGDSLYKAKAAESEIQRLVTEFRRLAESATSFVANAISNAIDPAAGLYMLAYFQRTANSQQLGLPGFEEARVNAMIRELAAKFPGHTQLAELKAKADARDAQLMASSWIGKQAPEIALPDVNGKEVKLSSFRGKYVLVDFWASWCGPCREENPNVVKAFNNFKDKNFTILGVSLDRPGQKDKWLKAIKEDGLTWTHVSDLQFWNSPVVAQYGFTGIPYNVLVDPDGKVIAEGLRGPGLEAKLREVLK